MRFKAVVFVGNTVLAGLDTFDHDLQIKLLKTVKAFGNYLGHNTDSDQAYRIQTAANRHMTDTFGITKIQEHHFLCSCNSPKSSLV